MSSVARLFQLLYILCHSQKLRETVSHEFCLTLISYRYYLINTKLDLGKSL